MMCMASYPLDRTKQRSGMGVVGRNGRRSGALGVVRRGKQGAGGGDFITQTKMLRNAVQKSVNVLGIRVLGWEECPVKATLDKVSG